MPPPLPQIDETQAREIARRWGAASGSHVLSEFARTGLIEDRKKLSDAIHGVRALLKHPFELDSLLHFIGNPCRYEAAAREQGWVVEDTAIYHAHDYDRAVSYGSWRDCCEAEDIIVNEDSRLGLGKR
jgi:hypothetical protein